MLKRKLSAFIVLVMVFSLFTATTAAALNEAEPNDAMNQATQISLNQEATGNIANSTDVDYYVFTLSNKGSVSLSFNYLSGTPGHRVRLYDSESKEIQGESFYNSNVVFPYTMDKIRLPAGTYYIRVDRYSNQAFNDYVLKVNYTDESSGNFESEPNASVNQANPITNGTPITGNVESSNDVDYYSFTIPGNGSLQLTFNYTSGTPGHRVRLYDSASKEIQGESFYNSNIAFPYTMDKLRLPAGTYYIRIERYSNQAFNDYTIKYDFTDETGKPYEVESNDSTNTATEITVGAAWTGNIQNQSDRDYYRFTISKNQKISLDFNYLSGTPGHRVRLFDSNNKELLNEYYYSSNVAMPARTGEVDVVAGTYYILIERYSNIAYNDYTIKVNGEGAPVIEEPTTPVAPITPPASGDSISGFNTEAINVGVKLWWNPLSGGVGYRVYRSDSPNDVGISITDFYITYNEFVDVNVKANTKYYYTVRQVIAEAKPFDGMSEVLGPITSSMTVTTPAKIVGDSMTPPSAGAMKKFILMTLDDPYMAVNGIRQEIDPGRGTTPLLLNSRTMVPIRAIVEGMGGKVGWQDSNSQISLDYGQHSVRMWLNKQTISVGSKNKEIDVPPTTINSRTMVPIRFAAENLGCEVDWLNSTRQVVIVYY